jgi:NAD(P)H-hydrate epimerase
LIVRDVIVTDSRGAAAADAAAIAADVPSRALMQRAGAAAAAEIAVRFADRLHRGVVVVTGAGNNGGDGWVIAQALHVVGIRVRVVECDRAKTPDAIAERTSAIAAGVWFNDDIEALSTCGEDIVVDALVGTGMTIGDGLRGRVATSVAALHVLQRLGRAIVAIDVPTGLDATTGQHAGAPRCALTLTFGTIKRGHVVARDICGDIVLLDIGLGTHASAAGAMRLATPAWFRATLPDISPLSNKGTRGKIAIVGGAEGMAGAAMLAARGALRSGAGLVKCVVARESVPAIQEGEPAALCAAWPDDDASCREQISDWADAVLIGPGLGKARARELTERVLRCFDGPVVIDADALNVFAGDAEALAPLIGQRQALLTPHPAEFGRLTAQNVDDVLLARFDAPGALATTTTATVLLKGVPTIVSSPRGETMIVAEGTAILATGGAGDVLGGIAATLLAQTRDAMKAGTLAAFAHGRAAAAVSAKQVRGFTLDDVLAALPEVWSLEVPAPRPPILTELPALGAPS